MKYMGQCVGGPLNGLRQHSRFPKGFLVVNRPAGEVVIYDAKEGSGEWVARTENGTWRLPEITDEEQPKNRYRAALEPNYDVLAYDKEEMPPWE